MRGTIHAVLAVATLALAGCATGTTGKSMSLEQVPVELSGEPLRYEFDGVSDDLLTAGLGADGLRGPPPGFANPLRPTALELRRRAIYTAYRGLVDVTEAGGFGRFYGPSGGQKIAGREYLLAVKTPDGASTTTVMLQIPTTFDVANPCLVAVASSGSRGIYGAVPTAGEWGLRHGCAVVHTDKGTGIGVWDLDRGRGYRIDGTVTEDAADPLLTYAPPPDARLAAFAQANPHSLLFKHASSMQNPEADWGTYVLQAIRVAFELLNADLQPKPRLRPDNTLVIAAGISNGGASVLRAIEKDKAGWIDGAIALEPNAILHGRTAGLAIESGGRRTGDLGIGLYDYTGLHLLYQPCAMLAEKDSPVAFAAALAPTRPKHEQWCRDLQARGFLPAGDVAAAANAARDKLRAAGILDEGLRLGAFNVAATLWPALTVTYSAAYARLSPWEPPCGVSFAAVDPTGRPRRLTDEESVRLFADGSGIAPTGGAMLVAKGVDGERRFANDGTVDLAICYAPDRVLAEVDRSKLALPADRDAFMARVRAGQDAIAMSAQPGNRPVIVLHGRSDGLIPVNHSSRAYYAVNQRDRGTRDELRYYELQHGQHFDAFLPLPGFAEHYVPMQAWMSRAFDAMFARLKQGTPLPPSQVLRSKPRANAAVPYDESNLGQLRSNPGTDAIRFENGTLHVPH